MFNVPKTQAALNGLVGFKQPANPDYAFLDAENQVSRSGRFVTDNSLCKLEHIKDNYDYKDATNEQLNAFLQAKQKKAIVSVCDRVFNRPDFIDRQMLYQFANNKQDVETLPDGFVGYEIEVALDKNWAYEITRAIFEFQGAGDVELLIWNSNKKEPLFKKTITISEGLHEEPLNWRLDNTNIVYKGKYYFGYITNGLTVSPYKRDYENANVMSTITGMGWRQIEVIGHSANDTLFDLNNIDGSDISIGVNPDITVFKDATDTIIQNQPIFAKAIEMQLTIDLLQMIVGSLRFNLNSQNSKELLTKITVELEGLDPEEGIKKTGLKRQLLGEVNHLRAELDRIRQGYFAHGLLLNTLT
jgi:hypothetical protein